MELQEKGVVGIELINDYWGMILFVIGIIWKQISTHFEVMNLKSGYENLKFDQETLHKKTDLLESEFQSALKDHIVENRKSIDKLADAVTELVKTTTIIATKIEINEKYKESQNNRTSRN
jgi:hypothetical protein